VSREWSKSSRWWAPALLVLLLGSVGPIGAWWQKGNDLQPIVCRASYFGIDWVQDAVDNLPKCDGFWERYHEDETTDFFMRYLEAAGGATPERARTHLAPALRERTPERAFEARWGGTLWADITGPVVAGDRFNQFIVRYRTYHGDGKTDDRDFTDGFVTDWRLQVRLTEDRDDDDAVKIYRVNDERRLGTTPNQHYPRLRATEPTKAYTYPTRASDPAGPGRWRAGRPAPALCRTSAPSESKSLWYRTRLGWVDGASFTVEEKEGSDRKCGTLAAQRAVELELERKGQAVHLDAVENPG
jgi:hypothetical protein